MVPSLVPSKFPDSLKKMLAFSVSRIAPIDPYRRIARIDGHNETTRNMGNIGNRIETARHCGRSGREQDWEL
jgi:hypothetical protein